MVHNVELKAGKGGQLARSAGSGTQLIAKEGKHAILRLPSSEMRMVPIDCKATIGQVGNIDHENMSLGKAGRKRWLGKTPHVRGVAMNPVDHPMGGGEGTQFGRTSSLHAMGRSHQGLPYAQAQKRAIKHASISLGRRK